MAERLAFGPGAARFRGRAGTWAVAAEMAVMFAGGSLPTPLYVIYRRMFQFSEITLTLIFAAYVVGALAALFFLGRLSDQFGRARTTLPAIAAAAVSTLLFLVAGNLATLFVARALSGFSIGLASGAGTAWIAELHGGHDRRRATLVAVVGNFAGLGVGPVLAGVLAQYGPAPLQTVFVLFLALLVPAALLTLATEETVDDRIRRLRDLPLQPRLGVPHDIRAAFVAPAVTAFAIFALLGFYTSLTPSLLTETLHQPNHAVGGAVVSELFAAALAVLLLTRALSSRAAMLSGLALLVPSLGLLVLALEAQSMVLLLVGTALGGGATALGYRGSLQVVNEIAPRRQHAELVSSYFVACYCGLSLPVIGIGVLSRLVGSSAADMSFAAVIALCALAALVMGWKYTPER